MDVLSKESSNKQTFWWGKGEITEKQLCFSNKHNRLPENSSHNYNTTSRKNLSINRIDRRYNEKKTALLKNVNKLLE